MREGFEKCLPFLNSEALPVSTTKRAQEESPLPPLAITLSRQSGSGAHCIAASLADFLQARSPRKTPTWTVFDRNLVEQVLQDHQLPQRLAKFMPEDRIPGLSDVLDELLGTHPPSWTLVEQTTRTIVRLAEMGNVILIGRGAHITTSKLPHVFHVRLVGSLEKRIEHIGQTHGLGRKEALALIRQEDRGRQRYLKKYFGKDIDDPLSYHLTINTDSVSYESAAHLIGEAALEWLQVKSLAVPATQTNHHHPVRSEDYTAIFARSA